MLEKTTKAQGKREREEKRNRELQKQPENIQQNGTITYLPIITLNANGLNLPIESG